MNNNNYYYKASIRKSEIVHFVALFRSIEDNIAFDRIENPKENIFEFFVSKDTIVRFLEIMELLLKNNIILSYWQEEIKNSSIINC
jgi:hypothetical protein